MNDSNQRVIIQHALIKDKIYYLRDQKVMLDKDLAVLYGVKTIRLREQVKRNRDRFPKQFMFQLTDEEANYMVSQFAIPSKQQLGGFLPYAFTEYGILMVANVLKSSRAILMSIRIIEVFVKMHEMLMTQKDLLTQLELIEKRVGRNSDDIQIIFKTLKQLLASPQVPRPQIGYKRNNEK